MDRLGYSWLQRFPGVGEPADAQRAGLQFGGWRIGESSFVDGQGAAVFQIMSGDGSKDTCAVLRAARHRSDFVHGRSERHGAVTADAPVGRPQAADAAKRRGTDD